MDRTPQMTAFPPLPSSEYRCTNCTGCNEIGALRCWEMQEKFKRAVGKDISIDFKVPVLTLADVENLQNWAIAYLAHQPEGALADRFAGMILACCELATKQIIAMNTLRAFSLTMPDPNNVLVPIQNSNGKEEIND